MKEWSRSKYQDVLQVLLVYADLSVLWWSEGRLGVDGLDRVSAAEALNHRRRAADRAALVGEH